MFQPALNLVVSQGTQSTTHVAQVTAHGCVNGITVKQIPAFMRKSPFTDVVMAVGSVMGRDTRHQEFARAVNGLQ
jgi:hypothetical protein